MDDQSTSGVVKLTPERIDRLTDGELFATVEAAAGYTFAAQGSEGMPLAVMEAAGRRGWEMLLIHRAGLGLHSRAAVATVPGYQADFYAVHARPEIALYRAFLYAVHACPP